MINYILNGMTMWFFLLLAVLAIVVSGLIGFFMGGAGPRPVVRTTAIVGFLSAGLIALDKYMSYWEVYANSSRVRGRPIATVGASTPGPGRQLLGPGHRPVHPPAAADDRDHPDLVRQLHALLAREHARGDEPGLHPHRARQGPDRSARSIVRHAFRNALIPITTIIAFDVGAIIGGAVVTETVFGWSGMGRLFVDGSTTSTRIP